MNWRVAESLEVLRKQFNNLHPNRSKISDGGIGDIAHSSRTSDHNPGSDGIVEARDFTHDPVNGMDMNVYSERIRMSKDPRIKYIIWNHKISNPSILNGAWRNYTGSNPHTKHMHLSVCAKNKDDATDWRLGSSVPDSPMDTPVVEEPVLKQGNKGDHVRRLQKLLGIKEDGDFGPITKKAVVAFQKTQGLPSDGIVGQYTWEALQLPALPKPEVIKTDRTHVYLLYGLGGPIWSAGINTVVGEGIRKIPNTEVYGPYHFYEWDEIVEQIKNLPEKDKVVVIGHSLGAATGTYITDDVYVDLLVLYDLAGASPSFVGKNTGRCIDIYDQIPDIVPEWRVQAVSGFEDRIERWTSNHGHTRQDDSLDLANKVVAEVETLTKKEVKNA